MDDRKLQMDSGDAATSEALQEASVSAPPLVAASQQDAPAPVEGKRNYGYPDEFMMYRFKVTCDHVEQHAFDEWGQLGHISAGGMSNASCQTLSLFRVLCCCEW